MTLMIATPVYGGPPAASVSLAWHTEVVRFLRTPDVTVADAHMFTNTDLVKARSRAVAMALEGGYDHLLFWDADVVGDAGDLAEAIRGMLASGHDLVGLAPPRKRAGKHEAPPDYSSAHGTAKFDGTNMVRSCLPTKYLPMGFTLISRACMQRMTDHFRPQLEFKDQIDGVWRKCVALFSLVLVEGPLLLSEDYSFCERWRFLDGQPWLYVGKGAQVKHVGAAVYG